MYLYAVAESNVLLYNVVWNYMLIFGIEPVFPSEACIMSWYTAKSSHRKKCIVKEVASTPPGCT